MTDIDISNIKPGDTVRYHFQDSYMEELGIKPKEGTSQVYKKRDLLCSLYVDGHILQNWGLTILEHIPARPEWADALVVRNEHSAFLRDADDSDGTRFRGVGGGLWSISKLLEIGPIRVVLDKDGNPPGFAEEWLDADALCELPEGSVVIGSYAHARPHWRSAGLWRVMGRIDGGTYSHNIAPARVLWKPAG